MSKYRQRGAYHYTEFNANTPYRHHVEDLVIQVSARLKKPMPKIIEIGAGEGLILSRFQIHAGFMCKGCDTDPVAVDLARYKKNDVKLGSIELFEGEQADAVLLCDVLEHVQEPLEIMEKAVKIAPMVVIACPDREDPHAVNDGGSDPGWITRRMQALGFEVVHKSQRHARHLMIFERGAGD